MNKAPTMPENLMLLQTAIAQRSDATFEIIDVKTQRLAKVTVGNKVFYPSAVKIPTYPLNSANAAALVTDKAYTNLILDQQSIARTEGEYFFARAGSEKYNLPGIEDAATYAAALGYPVFCKQNRGAFGSLADVCFNDNEITTLATTIASNDYIFLVQRFYTTPEFRIFCVDGEIKFGYERTRPAIVGDGLTSVGDLIAAINSRTDYDTQRINIANNFLRHQLSLRGYSVDTILKINETLTVSGAANIARGGQITNLIKKDFSSTLKQLAQDIHRHFDIRVYGIDFFAPYFLSDEITVIEINHNPSLKGIAGIDIPFSLSVWHQILDSFKTS